MLLAALLLEATVRVSTLLVLFIQIMVLVKIFFSLNFDILYYIYNFFYLAAQQLKDWDKELNVNAIG
jgi:hypothetical protein